MRAARRARPGPPPSVWAATAGRSRFSPRTLRVLTHGEAAYTGQCVHRPSLTSTSATRERGWGRGGRHKLPLPGRSPATERHTVTAEERAQPAPASLGALSSKGQNRSLGRPCDLTRNSQMAGAPGWRDRNALGEFPREASADLRLLPLNVSTLGPQCSCELKVGDSPPSRPHAGHPVPECEGRDSSTRLLHSAVLYFPSKGLMQDQFCCHFS